jgi:mono/diheme cytochrome c family protein
LRPDGRASQGGIEIQTKGEHNRQTHASAKARICTGNRRESIMRNAVAVCTSFLACALAGVGAAAWAQDQVEAGAQLYEEHCMGCHGEKLKAPGTSFDLRKLTAEERPRFDKFVLDGKGQMPPWRGTLNEAELDQLWAYIRARAY